MRTTNTILIAGLFAALLATACTESQEPTEDELAGESDQDGEAIGKADGPESTFTYYTIRQDYRRCVFPLCGGYHLSRVNRAYTQCADGSWAESCYVPELDWATLGMPEDQIQEVRGNIESGKLLVRGTWDLRDFGGSFGRMGVLKPTEVWMAGSDSEPAGVMTRVTDSGLRCITTPCYNTLREGKINSYLGADLSELYLDDTGVSPEAMATATAKASSDEGLIVTGYRYYWWDGGWQKGRYVTQFWERVLPRVASECVVGGCSGQVCSDAADGPAITTCEWRPEYACYRTATCERQDTGRCGWTMDTELSECLDNPPPL